MRRLVLFGLITAAALSLGGCLYEQKVTTVEHPLGQKRCFQGEYGGSFRFTLLVHQRRPTGIGRFPDGGAPLDLSAQLLAERLGEAEPVETWRAEIPLFRQGDFGNLERAELSCQEPNRILFRVENGYLQDRKVTSGEFLVSPNP